MSAQDRRSVVKELSISWDFKAHLNKDFFYLMFFQIPFVDLWDRKATTLLLETLSVHFAIDVYQEKKNSQNFNEVCLAGIPQEKGSWVSLPSRSIMDYYNALQWYQVLLHPVWNH